MMRMRVMTAGRDDTAHETVFERESAEMTRDQGDRTDRSLARTAGAGGHDLARRENAFQTQPVQTRNDTAVIRPASLDMKVFDRILGISA